MTAREYQYLWFAIIVSAAVGLWGTIGWLHGQPQPRVDVDEDLWALLEYDNGSQWYVKRGSVQALHAIPGDSQEALGHKTVIYLMGARITTPYTAKELQQKMRFGNFNDLVQE